MTGKALAVALNPLSPERAHLGNSHETSSPSNQEIFTQWKAFKPLYNDTEMHSIEYKNLPRTFRIASDIRRVYSYQ